MSLSNQLSSENENDCLVNLLDKYIKSSDNFLPFKAYLQYLEENSLHVFSIISCVKNSTANLSGKDALTKHSQSNKSSYNSNLASTLLAINKINDKTPPPSAIDTVSSSSRSNDQELILAQKLYRIIISIDYSTQISNIDFIQKSLEKIFEKLATEYYEFYRNCMQIEPTIYVTVVLWNSSFFQCPRTEGTFNRKFQFEEEFIPFTILCHAKRLLKSNLKEIAAYIFEKFNETKLNFLKFLANKNSYENIEVDTNISMTAISKKESHRRNSCTFQTNFGSLEQLLTNLIRIFSFFSVNEFSANMSAPPALAISHHIYITDGLLYATDMIRCLEMISKSSIVFSFISYGSNNPHSTGNIASGFGYVPDHYLMSFLTTVTNGFYAIIDENLDFAFITKKNLLYYPSLCVLNDGNNVTSTRVIFS